MDISVIIAAAGKGERAGFGKNKLLVSIGGESVLSTTLSVFKNSGLIKQYIITASKEDYDEIKNAFPYATVVLGGSTRTESVKNALKVASCPITLIHDGARPFVTEKIIKDCIDTAIKFGSAIPVMPTRNTLIKEDGTYVGKSGYYEVQTPQGFITEEIKKAYDSIDCTCNDDGEVYAKYIKPVTLYTGNADNVKLTFKEDFKFNDIRYGVGFDCHKLVENRKLILGGIEIPHDKGLLGHSDADVLAHAVMDAILSACSMRDIGYHFPDNDASYKNADSMKLLNKVLSMADENGFRVHSVSAVIMAEKPKLLKFIPQITENLSTALGISTDNVGLTATTLEGLGFVGREKGICVHANAVVKKI